MRIALYTSVISPHQMPLARSLVKLIGSENFRYLHWKDVTSERRKMGWFDGDCPEWVMAANKDEAIWWLMSADAVLFNGWENLDLLEQRVATGRKTYYITERWFKPPLGWARLLIPKYLRIAFRIGRLIGRRNLTVLPIGIIAAQELALLFAREKILTIDRSPLGRVGHIPWMRLWGYFVEPSRDRAKRRGAGVIRILWVGRFLRWKDVGTLLQATYEVAKSRSVHLTLVGDGVDKARMIRLNERLSCKCGAGNLVTFLSPVPIARVRVLMQEHDVYVLPSNGYEGWGAVVSEALEEGMVVFGTDRAGSSATVLPQENQFTVGDYCCLAKMILGVRSHQDNSCSDFRWTPDVAAQSIVSDVKVYEG